MKLKPEETLFKDDSVFEPSWLPEDFLFRDAQMKELAACIKPALRGGRATNAFIFGRPATGKTTATKLIFLKAQEESQKTITVHVNCHIYNSEYRILGEIHKKIFGFVPPETGIPVTALYDKVFAKLEKEKKSLVLALDDMNFSEAKQANALLYNFLRAYEIYPKVKSAVWCISVQNELHRLDDKVRSSFISHTMEFQSYKQQEIRDILKARAVQGLAANAINNEMLDKIAGAAADLRHGIELLKRAAMLAENDLSSKIQEKHVSEAIRRFETPASSSLEKGEKTILDLLKKKQMESGELYEEFNKATGASYATFYRVLQKLKKGGLITIENIGKEKGRTSMIRLVGKK